MNFQLAEERDLEAILALYRSCADEQENGWNAEYPAMDFIIHDFQRQSLYTLKTVGGELIGAGALTEGEEVAELKCNDRIHSPLELSRIAVRPDAQGHGAGQQLIALLIEEAGRRGADGLVLLTARTNQKAKKLYLQVGFQKRDEVQMYGTEFEVYDLCLLPQPAKTSVQPF